MEFSNAHKEFLDLLIALDREEGKLPEIALNAIIHPQYLTNETDDPILIDPDNTQPAIHEINRHLAMAKGKAYDNEPFGFEATITGNNARILQFIFESCPVNQIETLKKYLYRIGAISVNDEHYTRALFILPPNEKLWFESHDENRNLREPTKTEELFFSLIDISEEIYPETSGTILNDIPSDFTLGGLTPEEYIDRHTLDPEQLKADVELFQRLNKSPSLFLLQSRPDRNAQRMLVDRLIPNSAITLLAGPEKLGKSTLATELAVAVTSGHDFLGLPIVDETATDKTAVMLCGEDDANTVHERIKIMGGDAGKMLLITSEKTIDEVIEALEEIDPNVLIIDPLRAYLKGDEDNSGVCSEFFDQYLKPFAQRKNCAVVVVHHIKEKGRRINTLSAVINNVRGSGVITNRPRVLIGMVEAGNDKARIGIVKHNLPPSCNLLKGHRDFYKDAVTHRFIPLEQYQQVAPGQDPDSALDEKVIAAVQSQNQLGIKVTRTNKHGLFEQGLAALSGYSRNQVRDALGRCIQRGAISVDADGGLVAA